MKHKTGYELRCPKWHLYSRTIAEGEFLVKWFRTFHRANRAASWERSIHPKPETVKLFNIKTGKEIKIDTFPETEAGE